MKTYRTTDLTNIDKEIRRLKSAAEKLHRRGEDFPALSRNTARILAGIKMLELNVCDLVALTEPDPQQGFQTEE